MNRKMMKATAYICSIMLVSSFSVSTIAYDTNVDTVKTVTATAPKNLETAVSAPEQTTIISSSRTTEAIRINWKSVKCDGYKIVMRNADTTSVFYAVNKTTYKVKGLLQDTSYSFTVTPYNSADGENTFASVSRLYSVTTKSVAPSKLVYGSSSRTKSSIRVNWSSIKCDGYEVSVKKYSDDDSTYKVTKILPASATTYKATGLLKGTRYVIRIRAYTNYGTSKKHGEYSENFISTKPIVKKKDGAYYVDGILIANKSYSLSSSYNPGGLTSQTSSAFARMQKAAANDGINLWICSGFRSYSYQKTLYNYYVARDGQEKADTYSARAGYSEHQTGLALDVNKASSSFAGTKEAIWLEKNCSKYGFIIRYPSDKVDITGYKYEPWHIRYVGKTLATNLTKSGLCLEEYLGITSTYSD